MEKQNKNILETNFDEIGFLLIVVAVIGLAIMSIIHTGDYSASLIDLFKNISLLVVGKMMGTKKEDILHKPTEVKPVEEHKQERNEDDEELEKIDVVEEEVEDLDELTKKNIV